MHINHKVLAVATLAVFVLPVVASAQSMTSAQLQAEIQALTAQLNALEQQLAAQGGTTTAWCHTFTTNLRIGMMGPDVTALQEALEKDGEQITQTGTFDDQTASAVTGFQQKYASTILAPYGLTNGTGYAGKATPRSKDKEIRVNMSNSKSADLARARRGNWRVY
jgi:peptidoglycan hydrolase-like protein with peptidoglycan-binding domain